MKKLITKYILKYLNGSSANYRKVRESQMRYHFLRFLVEYVKDENKSTMVQMAVADFLRKKGAKLPYDDLFVVENCVFVHTTRPGLWIGRAGGTVYELEHRLNYNVDDKKVSDYHMIFLEDLNSPMASIERHIAVAERFGF